MFIFSINNIDIVLKSNIDPINNKFELDIIKINNHDIIVNIESFIQCIETSYFLDIFIPNNFNDILQKINDYFKYIELSQESSKDYYYVSIINIILKCFRNKKYHEIKKFIIEYLDNSLDYHNENYIFIVYLLKNLSDITNRKNHISKINIHKNYSIYDVILDKNF